MSRESEPMRPYAGLAYLFLCAPIALIVLFSFNAGRYATDLRGFSVQWYGKALTDPFVLEALRTSLLVGMVSACCATLFGTMAALALQRVRGWPRAMFDGFIYVAIMIPGIVIGIATLVAMATLFNAVNPALAAFWPGAWGTAPRLQLG